MKTLGPPDITPPMKNRVALRMQGNLPVIVVYVNNPYEEPGQTLRDSEYYKYFSEQHGAPYPHWKMIEAPGLHLKVEN